MAINRVMWFIFFFFIFWPLGGIGPHSHLFKAVFSRSFQVLLVLLISDSILSPSFSGSAILSFTLRIPGQCLSGYFLTWSSMPRYGLAISTYISVLVPPVIVSLFPQIFVGGLIGPL
jgi:hypothetical protein